MFHAIEHVNLENSLYRVILHLFLYLKVLNPKKKGKKKKYINSGTVGTIAHTTPMIVRILMALSSVLILVTCFLTAFCLKYIQVTLLSFKVESEYTFVDYIRGG